MKTVNEPFPPIEKAKAINAKVLTGILFWQNIAASRNVSMKKRYLALAEDIGSVINDEDPMETKELVIATRLPDRS